MNKEFLAGTTDDSSTNADVNSVSPTCPKPFVVGSLFECREIKFRAFIRAENRMVDIVGFEFRQAKFITLFYEGGFRVETTDNVCLLQYTGLEDKNGKEIYEGDIVKRTIMNFDYDEIDNPNVPMYKDEFSFIVYRNQGFWVNDENFGWEGENLWDWSLMEVIGNIFQNPELLQSVV